MRTSKGGFTLVEILTVIAIIVILAAVLLPVLGRAQEQSNRTHCMSNLHQIAMALKLYKLDERAYPYDLSETAATQRPRIAGERWYGSTDPNVAEDTPDKRNPGYGLASLYPHYVESVRLFNCPDNETDRAVGDPEDSPEPPVTQAEATPSSDKISPYQSYDGFDYGSLNQLKYCRSWRSYTTADDRHYARQLKWRYPPEDTVITWCSQHRSVTDPADPSFGNATRTDKDIVLYLDGTTKVVPTVGSTGETGSGHLSLPGEPE